MEAPPPTVLRKNAFGALFLDRARREPASTIAGSLIHRALVALRDTRRQEWFDAPAQLANLPWDVIESDFWFDTPDDPDRCRRKQAELLVHQFVPWEAVVGFAAIDDGMVAELTERLRASGLEPPHVEAMPRWYYGS